MSPNRMGAILLVLLVAPASAQEVAPETAREAVKLIEAANQLMAEGQLDEAIPKLIEAGELNPAEFMAPYLVAECEFRLGVDRDEPGRIARAKEQLDRAFRINPEFGGTFFLVGLIGTHEKNFRAAIFGFEKAFAFNYRVTDTRGRLAQCLFYYGLDLARDPRVDPADATRVFLGALDRLEAVKDDLRFSEEERKVCRGLWLGTMTNLVSLYQVVGEPRKALKLAQRLIRLEPQNHINWYNLGLLHGTATRFDEAMEAYEKALELRPDPDWIEPYPRMAYIQSERGKNAEAEKLFHAYLAKHPDSWDGHFHFAGYLVKTERLAEAIEAYERCVELDPREIGAMFELSQALETADEPERAGKWQALFEFLNDQR